MKVTGFDIRKGGEGGKSLAFGKVIIENAFEVDIKIVEGRNGLFVSYPSRKGSDGKWYQQFRFIDRELGDQVQDQIIHFFEKNIKGLA